MIFCWSIFSCCFLGRWAFHLSTVDVIYDITRVAVIQTAVPRISVIVPESSLAKVWWHLLGSIDNLIQSDISTVFRVLLLSDSQWLLEGLMIRAGAEGSTSSGPVCSHWSVSMVILCPFQSLFASVMSSPTFLGGRPRGPILRAKVDVAVTSSLVRLQYT